MFRVLRNLPALVNNEYKKKYQTDGSLFGVPHNRQTSLKKIPSIRGPFKNVAVKRVRVPSHDENDQFLKLVVREILTQAFASCDLVLPILEFWAETDNAGNCDFFIVTPFFEKESLRKYISSFLSLWKQSALSLNKLAYSVATSLEYCHRHRIHHRDIKPDNILIDDNRNAAVCDLGIAKLKGATKINLNSMCGVGTRGYMAPECYNGLHFGLPTDIYALGCVLYYILNGKEHQDSRGPKHIDSDGLIERLINQCWHNDPQKRPTAREVIDGFASGLYRFPGMTGDESQEFVRYMAERQAHCEDHERMLLDAGPMELTMLSISTWDRAITLKTLAKENDAAKLLCAQMFHFGVVFDRNDCMALQYLAGLRHYSAETLRKMIIDQRSSYSIGCQAEADGRREEAAVHYLAGIRSGCKLCGVQLGLMMVNGRNDDSLLRMLSRTDKAAAFAMGLRLLDRQDPNATGFLRIAADYGHIGAGYMLELDKIAKGLAS
jgi:serine/threonine protein kinase